MAPNRQVLVTIGSRPRNYIQNFQGHAIMFDTAADVLSADAPDREAIHLTVDAARPAPTDVPNVHVAQAGRDGSSLDASYSRRAAMVDRDAYRKIIQRAVQRADTVFVIASAAGGTGTGARESLLQSTAQTRSARVIDISEINPLVNPQKAAQRIKDLTRGTPDGVTSVIARDASNVLEVRDVEPVVWDKVNSIILNLPAIHSETELSLLQVRRATITESTLVDSVVAGLAARDIPSRWKNGSGSRNKSVDRIRVDLVELLHALPLQLALAEIDTPYIQAALRTNLRVVRHVVRGLVDRALEHSRAELLETFAALARNIPVVGYENIEADLFAVRDALNERVSELEEQLGNGKSTMVIDRIVNSTASFRGTLSRLAGRDNHEELEELSSLIRAEVEFENAEFALQHISRLSAPPALESSPAGVMHLPAQHELTQKLVDAFFAGDNSAGFTTLRKAVAEHFGEVATLALGSVWPGQLQFGFQITHEARAHSGLVISARVALEELADAFHTDPMNVGVLIRDDCEAISVTTFSLVRRLSNVPELAELVRSCDAEATGLEDRRMFARSARDLFQPEWRETRGVPAARASLLLAQAAVVPGFLRVGRESEPGVELRPGLGMAAAFPSFEAFARTVTVRAEHAIHDAFWSAFARDPGRIKLEIAALTPTADSTAEISTDSRQARTRALRRFAHPRTWDTAVWTLSEQVARAGEFWDRGHA